MSSTTTIQPVTPINTPTAIIDDVDLFCRLVQSGIDRWIEAGKLLCRAKEKDSSVLIQIMDRAPYLTSDILQAFLRIGEKKLYPYILLDASPASKKLSLLSYDRQVELYGKPVKVTYRNADGSFETYETAPQKLSRQEADLVFSKSGLRSIDDQKVMLQNGSTLKPRRRKPAIASTSSDSALVESPDDTVKRLLGELTAKLSEAREAIDRLGKPIPDQFAWIDVAMKAIRKLTRELNPK